jgi:hypothetical protein
MSPTLTHRSFEYAEDAERLVEAVDEYEAIHARYGVDAEAEERRLEAEEMERLRRRLMRVS